jgi:hypothetical protein
LALPAGRLSVTALTASGFGILINKVNPERT